MKKKVAIIGTNGLPAKYGGFETLVNNLTKFLNSDFDLIVYCSKSNDPLKSKEINGAKLVHLPLKANGLQSIFYDILSILHAINIVDTFLVLGTPGAIIFPFVRLFKKKIIVNFGGLEWKREKWHYMARRYLKFSEMIAVKFANVVVADNQSFINYIKKEYDVDAILIEYGGDHVIKEGFSENLYKKYEFVKIKYILSISRAQIDNNIHLLLEAFNKSGCNDKLVIISNWDSSDYGTSLKKKYNGIEKIILLDAIYDQQELDFLRNKAYLYIHTHSFCGTAPSLVEAMFHNLPIICYDVETNRFTTENKSIYFKNDKELLEILNNLDKLKLDSNILYEIAVKRYKWEKISNEYFKILNN